MRRRGRLRPQGNNPLKNFYQHATSKPLQLLNFFFALKKAEGGRKFFCMNDSKFQIRRADRALSREEAERILREAEFGTLALVDPDGNEPYGVPVSFVYADSAIWIHSANAGRKFEILKNSPQVHFSAVQNVRAVFTRFFTSFYESAMAFGRIVPVTDDAEKRTALRELCQKYLPERMDVADEHISASLARTAIFRLVPEVLTAKAKRP